MGTDQLFRKGTSIFKRVSSRFQRKETKMVPWGRGYLRGHIERVLVRERVLLFSLEGSNI